jgi:hypothetical protein
MTFENKQNGPSREKGVSLKKALKSHKISHPQNNLRPRFLVKNLDLNLINNPTVEPKPKVSV